MILLAIDGGQPRVLTLKQMLERFVAHRRDVVTRRTRFELKQARAREHILLGLQIALDHIDEIIELIRKAPDRDTAREGLITRFGLSELQAKAILEMQLQRLTGLERQKILDELVEVQKLIARLREILASEKVLLDVIAAELEEVRELFADERRTEILGAAADLDVEDLIKEEEMVVTVSHAGYVKRNPISLYRAQRRGGKGRTGAGTRDEDFLENLFVASTHSYLLVFSDKGKVYWLKVHEIPQAGPAARGKPIVNLVQLAQGEKVAAILPVRELPAPAGSSGAEDAEGEGEGATQGSGTFVFAATRRGLVKKTPLEAYARPRPSGIIALSIDEGDSLIAARITDGQSHILLSTAQGMAIRFEESEVRSMGRDRLRREGHRPRRGRRGGERRGAPHRGRRGGSPHHPLGHRQRLRQALRPRPSTGSRAAAARASSPSRPPSGTGRWWRPCRWSMPTRSCSSPTAACSSACRRRRSSVIGRNTQGVRLITVESREEQVAGRGPRGRERGRERGGRGGTAERSRCRGRRGRGCDDEAGEAPEGGEGSPGGRAGLNGLGARRDGGRASALLAAGCSSPDAKLEAANALRHQGRAAEALAAYREILGGLGDGTIPRWETGVRLKALRYAADVSYLDLGDYDGAIGYYRRIVSLYPGTEDAWKARAAIGDIYAQRLGDRQAAIAQYAAVAGGDAKEAPRFQLLVARQYLELRNYEQARTEARLLRERWPQCAEADEAQLLTAQAWALEDRQRGGAGRLPGRGRPSPRPEIAALALEGAARIHARQGRLDRAIELYTQAMNGHPNPDALRTSIDDGPGAARGREDRHPRRPRRRVRSRRPPTGPRRSP